MIYVQCEILRSASEISQKKVPTGRYVKVLL
jgi:hypothetical protein